MHPGLVSTRDQLLCQDDLGPELRLLRHEEDAAVRGGRGGRGGEDGLAPGPVCH
jgi:hypothetical protein